MAKSPYPPIPLFATNQSNIFIINSTNHLYVPFESITLSIVDIVVMSLFILAHLVAIVLAIVFLGVGYFMNKQKDEVQVLKTIQQAQHSSHHSQNAAGSRHSVKHQVAANLNDTPGSATVVELAESKDLIPSNVSDICLSPNSIGNDNNCDAQNPSSPIKDESPVSSNSKARHSTRLTNNSQLSTSNYQKDNDGMTKNQRILFILLLILLLFQMTSLILLIIHHVLNLSGHILIDNYILKRSSDISSGIISETSPIELVPSRAFRIADRFVGMFQAIVGASCYLIILYILCFIETVFIKTVQKTGAMSKRTAKIITTISVIVTVITTSLIFVSIVSSCVMIVLVKAAVITDDELAASLPGAALFIFQVVFHNIIFNCVGFKVLRTISQYSSKLNRQSSSRPFFRVIVLQIGLTVFTIVHLLGAVCLALYPSWEFFDAIAFSLSSIAILGYTMIIFFLYRPLFNDARIQAREVKKLIRETQ